MEENISYFETCKCPHCKKGMDEVKTSETKCPYCYEEIDAHDVWMTRKHSGFIPIPRWVERNVRPLGIILFGCLLSFGTYCMSDGEYIIVSDGLLIFGFVWLVYNLFSNDDKYAED